MGNQPSKSDKRSSGTRTPTGDGPDLDSYPSFSRSDTKESAKSSWRNLRTRIPNSISKSDSPRTSTANLVSPNGEKSDAASVKSSVSAVSNGKQSHRGSAASGTRPTIEPQ